MNEDISILLVRDRKKALALAEYLFDVGISINKIVFSRDCRLYVINTPELKQRVWEFENVQWI